MTQLTCLYSPADLGLGRLFGAVHEAVVVADVETGRIVQWNPAAEQLFGYTAGEAVGLTLEALVPKRLRAWLSAGLARYRETGRGEIVKPGRPLELSALCKDGTERTVELTLNPIDDAPVGGRFVLALMRDLTERKSEDQATRRLAAIVELSEDAIIGKTLDGVITSWNAGAGRLYGYAAGEVVGKPISLLHPPEWPDEMPTLLSWLRRGKRIEQYETQHVRKDGSRVEVSIGISPVRDGAGRLVGAATIARDITERKAAEEQRVELAREQAARAEAEAARDVAEHAVRLRDEFLDAAAHELKTPIASVKAYAQLVSRRLNRSETVDAAALRGQLSAIDQQAGRLTRLVEQLLDVRRIEAGRLAIECESVDISALVEQVAASVREGTEDRVIAVHAPIAIVAPADPPRLEQVVQSLLENALKYSPTGEPVDVAVEKVDAEERVRIAVRDRGIGIPPAQRGRLFERFHHAHEEDRVAGLGLGLYVARQVVQAHGGNLEASFPPDGGSCFVVSLPVRSEGGDSSDEMAE